MPPAQRASTTPSVIIVGSGPIGSTLVRTLLDSVAGIRVTVFEAGPALGDPPGSNVKNVTDLTVRAELQRRSQGPAQRPYGTSSIADRVRAAIRPDPERPDTLARPGTFLLSAAGADTSEMPAAAASSNVGGMGAHWTCACPWPADDEVVPELRDDWRDLVASAQSALSVSQDAYPMGRAQAELLATLQELFPEGIRDGRGPQRLPMAIRPTPDGLRWIGPSDILGGRTADPRLRLVPESLVTEVLMRGGRAVGVRVVDSGGTISEHTADAVVVAADAFRTPQLLWASGIRPAALGRSLNEHAQVISGVRLPDRGAAETRAGTDPVTGVLWVPYHRDSFPFHGQITSVEAAPLDIGAGASSSTLTLSWFCPTETDPGNRVEFSDTRTDAAGLPAMTIRFRRSRADHERITAAVDSQRRLASALGDPVDERGPVVMPAGSSLHYTGTVRIGAHHDGDSVCGADGRVWDTDNVYVAGTGTISTSVAGNPTLSGAAIAIRTARLIANRL